MSCNMVHKIRFISSVRMIALGVALIAHPCGLAAQRGGGGGHMGGGTVGGGAMGAGGAGTGLDVKDDLKGFHEALALQASTQQLVEYSLMVKSTESASAELRAFVEQVTKDNRASTVADRDKSFEQAVEKARTESATFIQRLSDRQKAGLKETLKRLAKADSDLAQQAKAMALEVGDTKADAQQIANSAQNLDRTLTSFHSQQLELGDEMSVGRRDGGQEISFKIPPVKSSVNFSPVNLDLGGSGLSAPIAIITSGVISKGALQGGGNTFGLELTADLSDLRQNITQVLRAQLDKADRCGEQITIQNATFTPSTPASMVLVQVHYERWACFGGGTPNEMVEGNGSLEVKLTPDVGDDGSLRVVAAIGRVDAQGLVGELLRSGSLGEVVRDRISESLLASVRQASNYKALLPPVAQGNVTLQRVQFQETGPGRLSVVLHGNIQVSSDKVTLLTSELEASEAKEKSSPAETTPR
jgi:hypothetical protein